MRTMLNPNDSPVFDAAVAESMCTLNRFEWGRTLAVAIWRDALGHGALASGTAGQRGYALGTAVLLDVQRTQARPRHHA